MMKKILFLAVVCLALTSTIFAQTSITIPLGGNAWAGGKAVITDDGLINWGDAKSSASVYFRVPQAQQLSLALRVRVPAGKSRISVSVGKTVFTKNLTNTNFDTISIGKVNIANAGYVKLSLKGISKTDSVYAQVSDLIVTGTSAEKEYTYVRPGFSYHFGRRGPSVHLRYTVPAEFKNQVKWFYNEIVVPEKNDIIGSYFMADGFSGGYFGMQVNSATERHVLFSVWSPFETDDPKSIPDSLRIKLLAKGATVHGGEFGAEGSGGQSYMNYPWQAGKTYAFLMRAEPDKAHNTTTYTAWFKDVAANKWMLVASFSRPQTNAYLGGLYSFLENFEPDNGDKTRTARYQNQWIGDANNQWHQITGVTYTGDDTARKNNRKDYSGGQQGSFFFLRNCGFFDDLVTLNRQFTRPANSQAPVIDINALPTN
ncbi:DUF3472 domain-containing protein [Inquilinus sp. KBS0705]|nr:DUF3472 domain-containing protein [Inquilinus sp. KBS0705]